MNHLDLFDGFALSPVERRDKAALLEHLQPPEIARNTLSIPSVHRGRRRGVD